MVYRHAGERPNKLFAVHFATVVAVHATKEDIVVGPAEPAAPSIAHKGSDEREEWMMGRPSQQEWDEEGGYW